jgi:glutamate dehydrogenase (NAD(P)+)
VGYYTSKFFHDEGCKVIAIIEQNSAIYDPAGLNVPDVHRYFTENKTLIGYPNAIET